MEVDAPIRETSWLASCQALLSDAGRRARQSAQQVPKPTLEFFSEPAKLTEHSPEDRLCYALKALFEAMETEDIPLQRFDKVQIDHYIARIDALIGAQLDEILHHPDFQALEASWRGLKYCVSEVDFTTNTRLDLLDVSRDEISEDFSDASHLSESALYHQLYRGEYDLPGGEPYGMMVMDFAFSHAHQDLFLLKNMGKIASLIHCPVIASAAPEFFGKKKMAALDSVVDLKGLFEKAEYIEWEQFRQTREARYIGLTLPKFLLRLPHGSQSQNKHFLYEEEVFALDEDPYLWGNAAYAFAANCAKAFKQDGWAVNIRGPDAGGKVSDLVLHQYDLGIGEMFKIPTELLISETRELELASLGFIPLSYYKNTNYGCFFSADSVQKPTEYSHPQDMANSKMNARLPYVFLTSRLAHYLKILQRENIGATKDRQSLEDELNAWLGKLVTSMENPPPDLAAKYPLKSGHIKVTEQPENPGFFKVELQVVPHFQIEGLDIELSLGSELPRAES